MAHALSLTYVPLEDRICWVCKCDDGPSFSVWVTRRHLLRLLPQMAEWLEAQSPLTQKVAAPPAVRREISSFEHQAAQQQVKAVRGRSSERSCVNGFLLNSFGLSRGKGEAAALTLFAREEGVQLVLPASLPELHKLPRELLEMGNAAGWEVPDPWPAPTVPHIEADRLTRH